MRELGLIILSTALVNNFVLAKFLGLCPVMGVSKKFTTAVGMSLATAFVLTLTAGLSFLIDKYLLQAYGLEFLRIIFFIITIAASVQFTESFIRWSSPLLYQVLGIFLPLITTNCAVLGLALLVTQTQTTFVNSLVYGLGTALGFSAVLIIFSSLRERLNACDVPQPFQGSSIAMISIAIMALAFMGFSGMVAP